MEATSMIPSACFISTLPSQSAATQNLNQRCLLFCTATPQRRSNLVIRRGFPNLRSPRASLGSRNVEASRVPTSVPVRVALELLQAGHKYLDVRTPEEFSTGHAPGAVNVPYLYRVGSEMTKNPNFLREVLAYFQKHEEIIVGCQSGKRSMMAATDLLTHGFTEVTDISGGFAAWRQNNLPME